MPPIQPGQPVPGLAYTGSTIAHSYVYDLQEGYARHIYWNVQVSVKLYDGTPGTVRACDQEGGMGKRTHYVIRAVIHTLCSSIIY